MNNICGICCFNINQGHVCRDCRENFRILSTNLNEFKHCLKCTHCDIYDFPCRCCAKYAFDGILGYGNGECDGYPWSNGHRILNLDEIVTILKENGDVILDDFEMSYGSVSEQDSIDMITDIEEFMNSQNMSSESHDCIDEQNKILIDKIENQIKKKELDIDKKKQEMNTIKTNAQVAVDLLQKTDWKSDDTKKQKKRGYYSWVKRGVKKILFM